MRMNDNIETNSQLVSRVATGTAPLVVSSTTVVANLNAAMAAILANARTIAISGGATGTATSFNGSTNISIDVTELDATKLSGVVPNANISGTYTGLTHLTGTGNVDFARFLGNTTDSATAPSLSWTDDPNTGIY